MSAAAPSNDPHQIDEIDPPDVEALLGSSGVLLDVREPDEWAAGHAPIARHLPLGQIADAAPVLGAAPVVVTICRSGARSMRAAEALAQAGFRVVNLRGGMKAWAAAGQTVIDAEGAPGQVI